MRLLDATTLPWSVVANNLAAMLEGRFDMTRDAIGSGR